MWERLRYIYRKTLEKKLTILIYKQTDELVENLPNLNKIYLKNPGLILNLLMILLC